MRDPAVIVFQESVTAERVARYAARKGWPCTADVTRGHFVLASARYRGDEGTSFEYLEDHTADVRFAQLHGPAQERLIEAVREAMPHHPAEALLRTVPQSRDPLAWIRGLSRLAVYRPTATQPRYLAIWSRALNHADPRVRRAAIRTTYGCAWPELRTLVLGRLRVEQALRQPLQTLARHLQRPAASDPVDT